jgi:aminoglycoside 3-N-acetyltransferase
MLSFREISSGFRTLGIDPACPVIVHASLSSLGEVRGGVETFFGGLLANYRAILTPAFTYNTMVVPEDGPEDNALQYGSALPQNLMGEFFQANLSSDPSLGALSEMVRRYAGALRSDHPILSFGGIGVESALRAQTLAEPLAPVERLAEQNGWVLLVGVLHTANISLHLAERQAGRPQFVRWALTLEGVKECPAFPGCSNGFEGAAAGFEDLARSFQLGGAWVRAYPLQPMLERVTAWIRQDPLAGLCDQPDCPHCSSVRRRVEKLAAN